MEEQQGNPLGQRSAVSLTIFVRTRCGIIDQDQETIYLVNLFIIKKLILFYFIYIKHQLYCKDKKSFDLQHLTVCLDQ